MATKKDVFDNYDQFVFPTYTRLPAVFVKGKGSILTDIDGKKYLDFFRDGVFPTSGIVIPRL